MDRRHSRAPGRSTADRILAHGEIDVTGFDYVFRADVGFEVGFGHLGRCQDIAGQLADGASIAFCLGGDVPLAVRRSIQSAAYTVLEPDEPFSAGVLVVDLSYARYLAHPASVRAFLTEASASCRSICVIDGPGDYALIQDMDWPVSAVVVPYVGARAPAVSDTGLRPRWYCGPEYMVLNPAYRECPRPRAINPVARRILVSHGGSDPHRLTERCVAALSESDAFDEIRIVAGPAFGEERWRALCDLTVTRPAFRAVSGRKTLFEDLLWCDLAVAVTGTTKYELAASGTPSVQFSLDSTLDQINKPFAAHGTSVDLGAVGDISDREIAAAISSLAGDYEARLAQSRKGQQLIDGRGLERISNVIETLLTKNE
jgi:spore coat polysaccharide biosynthesis predicted glycosyltransferase SpsG